MKSLGYKLKFIFSNPIKTIGKTLFSASGMLGFFVTLFEILDTAYKSTTHMDFLINKSIWWIIAGSLILSLFISIKWIPKISYTISGTNSKVTVRVGDILKYNKSLIISTNTAFVTTLTNDIISTTSVQGAFEKKFFYNNLDKLDKLIDSSLKTDFNPIDTLILNGFRKKHQVYEVGTVAKIRHNDRNVYFLALNDINPAGQNKNRNSNDFYTALDKLWLYLKQKGNVEEAAIHLIGSGHAGISEITKELALIEIVKSYIGQCQNYKILTNLVIYIHPYDLQYININKIKKYVENICMFAERQNVRRGNEEN